MRNSGVFHRAHIEAEAVCSKTEGISCSSSTDTVESVIAVEGDDNTPSVDVAIKVDIVVATVRDTDLARRFADAAAGVR